MKLPWLAFIIVLALTVVAQLGVDAHPHFEIERWFGAYALYGFLACAALILIAKALGAFLKRRDDYYAD
jgi:hypothetical protein